MKIKLLSLFVILMLSGSAAICQKLSVGLKAGADLGKIKGKSFDEEFKAGFHVGAFAEVKIKKIGIQPEIYFSQTNAEQGKDANSFFTQEHITKAKLNYLNIPILANLYFNRNVAFQLGPQFGLLLNQNITQTNSSTINETFKKGDLSLVGGLQFKIMKFRVYGRYVVGLNDKNDISGSAGSGFSDGKWKTQVAHLGIAYSFL